MKSGENPIKVMFVCSGNICRSPLAPRMFEKLAAERGMAHRFEVESSGTGAWHVGENADSRMRATAARRGWTLNHNAMQLKRRHLEEYDLIFAMDSGHRREIRQMASAVASLMRGGRDRSGVREQSGDGRGGREGIGERGGRSAEAAASDLNGKLRLFREFDPAADGEADTPDPYYDGQAAFEEVYDICERTCNAILDAFEAGRLP